MENSPIHELVHSTHFKQDMANANNASDNFVPVRIKNNKQVKDYLYLKRLDESYKRKPK